MTSPENIYGWQISTQTGNVLNILVVREMQIKIIIRYAIGMATKQKKKTD